MTNNDNPIIRLQQLGRLTFVLGLVLAAGACATNEDPDETTQSSALETDDPCLAPKATFATWKDVVACEKPNPPLYEASLGAVLAAGAKCVEETKEGCVAVSVDDPIFTTRTDAPWIGCWTDFTRSWPEGREYVECCLYYGNIEVCDWAWVIRTDT